MVYIVFVLSLRKRAFITTETELKDIANAATIGFKKPKAASGIAVKL